VNDRSLTRRRLLAGGVSVVATAASGCLDALESSGTERTLVLTLSPDDGPLHEAFVVDLSETERPWDEAAFAAALDGDEYTT
jgi:hypothetical protein